MGYFIYHDKDHLTRGSTFLNSKYISIIDPFSLKFKKKFFDTTDALIHSNFSKERVKIYFHSQYKFKLFEILKPIMKINK